ncbi:MAG: hypothetical protein ACI4W7_02730 [Candidatus Spyradenecus sp.]
MNRIRNSLLCLTLALGMAFALRAECPRLFPEQESSTIPGAWQSTAILTLPYGQARCRLMAELLGRRWQLRRQESLGFRGGELFLWQRGDEQLLVYLCPIAPNKSRLMMGGA